MSARKPRARAGASASNSASAASLRTVPATSSPRSSAALASARPRPLLAPVISHFMPEPSERLVAAHPQAVHLANVLGVVEEGAAVQGAAVVPHQHVAHAPFVAVDELLLGGELHQLL